MERLHLGYALVGVLGVLLAFWSSSIRRAPVSEPLLALLLGVLAGPVLGLIDLPHQQMTVFTLEAGRVLLAISLMAVALRFPLPNYRSVIRPVAVLLAVAMAGMAVVSAGLAWLVLGLPVALAVLLGACVTPTDPVLASSVVSGGPAEQQLPARLRQVISGESGANDGLAFVFVVLALSVVTSGSIGGRVLEAGWAVLGAVVIGVAVGYAAGRAVTAAEAREDVDGGSLLVFTLVLGIAALGVARVAGTDGILAVFVAGLTYNAVIGDRSRASEQQLDDALTRYLVLPVFFLLGVEVPWRDWRDLGWPLAAFVFLVLLLRRLPVVLALKPALGLSWRSVVFLGWFGPIGVSALFYLTHSEGEGARDPRLWAAGSLVVVASTVVHGVTATPGRRWYARRSSESAG
ncbi:MULTISPECIES: cation:proton antiporter [unclassified Micromonospora]|uniref:cation:proton antiporter n=1 Tax=unclassified Micromonospora TaxID=2617518 RepID=UPI001C238209|nr:MULTISPECIES: cation:proton antiporter [unclassified Micromonospora]MBU8858667.1 cation:proton antiporter [Micromonospora sp. WMMB482]MDM4784311.1 cation:proton antiporter [Micromonospora sp. b486]